MTIGVLTGGGDCPGLNAALRAVVKTIVGKYGHEVVGFKDGFRGLVKNEFRNIRLSDVSGLLDRGGTLIGTSTLDNPLDLDWRENVDKNKIVIETIKENMAMHDMTCLIVIGGDESIKTAEVLQENGINTITVPKSTANNISGTDMSFGYMTAIDTATEAIDKLHSTAESHHKVMIIEVLGDASGWIALESGMAGGADVILIPEIPYNMNRIARAVLERKNAGKNFSIIVVAQGAKSMDEVLKSLESQSELKTESGYECDIIRLGTVGELIADDISNITGIACEVTVLGSLLRGGKPNTYDRLLSTRFGVCAAENAIEGKFGVVVLARGRDIIELPYKDVLQTGNKVEPVGDWVMMAKALGVSFGD